MRVFVDVLDDDVSMMMKLYSVKNVVVVDDSVIEHFEYFDYRFVVVIMEEFAVAKVLMSVVVAVVAALFADWMMKFV